MGLFPSSKGNTYILVGFDYLSKWVEAKAIPTNDARVVCKFLKNPLAQIRCPRAIIISWNNNFAMTSFFAKVMLKNGVNYRLFPCDCPDSEASHARGFVLRSQELQILSFILGIRYPNLID
ncbi:reverse transcriptase domain-containing protein [Tanacetum coccineum]